MKKVLLILMLSTLSVPAFCTELSQDALQGSWLITKVGDLETEDLGIGEDVWKFEGDRMTVISSGISMRPDSYRVHENEIQLDSYSIEVSEFSPTEMVVEVMGIVQVLEKMSEP